MTAIDINRMGIMFGSISGYIGYYSLEQKKVKYMNDVQDELIRDVQLDKDNIGYAAVGDIKSIRINFSDFQFTELNFSQFKIHQP